MLTEISKEKHPNIDEWDDKYKYIVFTKKVNELNVSIKR